MRGGSDYLFGIGVVLLGVLILAPDSLLIRLSGDADLWGVSFWRALCAVPVFILLHPVFNRGRAPVLTGRTWALSVLAGVGAISFVLAVQSMGVANVLVILAAAPLIAALMAWAAIGDRLSGTSWAAVLIGGGGVALAGGAHAHPTATLGILAALVVAFVLAAQFTLIRAGGRQDVIASLAIGNLAAAAVCLMFGDPLAMPWEQARWPILAGFIVAPFSFALITLGPRYLPAAEVSLLMLLEAVFGPLLVWLGGFEAPDAAALGGGALVLAAVALMVGGKAVRRRMRG